MLGLRDDFSSGSPFLRSEHSGAAGVENNDHHDVAFENEDRDQ